MKRRALPPVSNDAPQSRLQIPEVYTPLFWNTKPDSNIPLRYKVFYGGRGSAKSWSMARALVAEAYTATHLILCTREYQNSIEDSVYRVVTNQIEAMGLSPWFDINTTSVKCKLTGSEFIFKGLRRNIQGVRSLEGVTRAWIEEAQWTTADSWLILDPTIRAAGSQIWVSYNPVNEDDPTHEMFTKHTPEDAYVRKTSWRDNPWFPPELERQRIRMLREDPGAYDWVWEGLTRRMSNAIVFKDRFVIEGFDEPEKVDRYYFGLDFGFANDPTFATRSYIYDDCLYVTHEASGINIEIDEIPTLLEGGVSPRTGAIFRGIPNIKDGWPIKADNARPETISYIARQGFNVHAAEKWSGSVEDGIAHLKGFKKIVVHPRCVDLAQEFRLYSYKTDPRTRKADGTEDILPVLIDKYNHGIDSLRYALDGYIIKRGGLGVWEKL